MNIDAYVCPHQWCGGVFVVGSGWIRAGFDEETGDVGGGCEMKRCLSHIGARVRVCAVLEKQPNAFYMTGSNGRVQRRADDCVDTDLPGEGER